MDGQNQQPQQPVAPQGGQSDVEKNKIWAIIGYIIPFLFFIPLVNEDGKNSPFAKFHANQQLVMLIAWIVIYVVGGIIPILGWFVIIPVGMIVLTIFAIIGIINASKGLMKGVPMIGGINIIK